MASTSFSSIQEDCPICCNELSSGDKLYPLRCPTSSCNYNYCYDCIKSMQKSASEGYQEASDGSRQLKVKMQCPQCRAKYQSEKNSYSSEIVVQSVLCLRAAHSTKSLLQQRDSDLTASQLAHKDQFIRTMSIEILEDSARRLGVYHQEIGLRSEESVPPPDLKFYRNQLPHSVPVNPSLLSSVSNDSSRTSPPWKDPTLFYGLDELMSVDEEEFVTQLLVSGKEDLLMQATLILHGMMHMNSRDNVLTAVHHLSNFSAPVRPHSKTKATIELHTKIRRQFPLPARMPLCVSLPVYHPENDIPLLNFASNVDLKLSRVRGQAGQLGLRQGDVVTHMAGEPVQSPFDYRKAMMELAERKAANNNSSSSTVLIVVNADAETAEALKERARKMQQANVFP